MSAKMINTEQKELSDYIRCVHLSLRRKSREIGAERAWEEHLKNEDVLRKYAFSMKKLAEEFWSVNNHKGDLCRIKWIVNYIVNYFQKGFIENEVEKELKKVEVFCKRGLINGGLDNCDNCNYACKSHIKLLDVGSCYNPFKTFEFLTTYPIDLYPASPEVKKCNFVEAKIVNLKKDWFYDNLNEIPCDFFDVVVFSLFLEYLPSPGQRYDCCVKAYECLRTNGLLLIVTPDSKHATANAHIMKSWKIAAAEIGFVRTKLEKLKYLHCMAFRKSVFKKYPLVLYNIKSDQNNFKEMFIIPQDSVDYKSEEKSIEKSEEEETESKVLFEELPWL